MNFHIPCLEFCFLYAGWIPMVWYFVKRKISVCRDTILLLGTEVAFSAVLLWETKVFHEFSVGYLSCGVLLGGVAFALEYTMGRKKKRKYSAVQKCKLSRLQFVVLMCIPVVEELYFRAAILQWVNNRGIQYGNKGLIFVLISAICVVVNHFQCFRDWTICMQKFLVEGLLFSGVYYLTGTIWITLAGHICFNLLNSLAFYDMGKTLWFIQRRLYEKN